MDEGESKLRESFSAQGYVVLPRFFADREIDALESSLSMDTGRLAGSRALIERPWCLNLAQQILSDPRLGSVWPAASRAVLCTYFEKSPVRNWLVALHQDLSIPVAERTRSPGYSGWSEKDGRLFVQPPLEALEQSVAARVHLDGSDEETGALKVAMPGDVFSISCLARHICPAECNGPSLQQAQGLKERIFPCR